MHRALWYLRWLRLRGWVRRLVRTVCTVKGALFVAFSLLLCCFWLGTLLMMPVLTDYSVDTTQVRRYGSPTLLGFALLITASGGKMTFGFSPAEVAFLFAGPFSRRQLLAYKIINGWLVSLLGGLFFTAYLQICTPWPLAAFIGSVLILMFMQLFVMAVALASGTVAAWAFNLWRKIILAIFVVLTLLILFLIGRGQSPEQQLELLAQVENVPVVQGLLTPFHWYVDVLVAEQFWPELIMAMLPCLAVNGLLLGLVFFLDARFLESAAAGTERAQAMRQRFRNTGAITLLVAGARKSRYDLPDFAWWGGAGPTAWRQLLVALRNLRGLLVLGLMLAFMLLMPLCYGGILGNPVFAQSPFLAWNVLGLSAVLLPFCLGFDFRADVDRIDMLKSLPVGASSLVAGQLITPVLLATFFQFASLTIIEVAYGGMGTFILVGAVFAVPFNCLLFEVVNLWFLWFPTRMIPATGAEFQMVGRLVLVMWGTYFSFFFLVGVPVLAAVLVYSVTEGNWPVALTIAWLALSAVAAVLFRLVVTAFRRFDVARDTPP